MRSYLPWRTSRFLPDGTLLQNRPLAALPMVDGRRIVRRLQMKTDAVGDTIQQPGARITEVYFPNGRVFSITNEMPDGALVEVATVGREGRLGVGAFLGDRAGAGRTFQQLPDRPLAAMAVRSFVKKRGSPGPFRNVVAPYAQASMLQVMQCAAWSERDSRRRRASATA